jgi:hypothetical protein
MELGDTGAISSLGSTSSMLACALSSAGADGMLPERIARATLSRTGYGAPGFSTADDSNWKHQQMLQAPS